MPNWRVYILQRIFKISQSYEDCYSSHQEELKGVRAVLDISGSWQVWGKGHWYFCSEGCPWRNVGEVWTEVCLLLYLLWISTSPSSSGRMTESSPSTTFGPEQWRRPWESSRTPGRTSRWWWRGGRGDWNLPNTSLSTSHSTTITGKDLSFIGLKVNYLIIKYLLIKNNLDLKLISTVTRWSSEGRWWTTDLRGWQSATSGSLTRSRGERAGAQGTGTDLCPPECPLSSPLGACTSSAWEITLTPRSPPAPSWHGARSVRASRTSTTGWRATSTRWTRGASPKIWYSTCFPSTSICFYTQ